MQDILRKVRGSVENQPTITYTKQEVLDILDHISFVVDQEEASQVDHSVEHVSFDWKDTEGGICLLVDAMTKLGLTVIDDPDLEGTDMYGYFISNKEISQEFIENHTFQVDEEE